MSPYEQKALDTYLKQRHFICYDAKNHLIESDKCKQDGLLISIKFSPICANYLLISL